LSAALRSASVGDAALGHAAMGSTDLTEDHSTSHNKLSAETSNSMMQKSKSTPGPGQYAWNDHVHVRRKPSWSVSSPERAQLDLMLGTWTPASTSLQPRAPDPGEYSREAVGRNGKYWAPQWGFGKTSGRSCMAPSPPEKVELELRLPTDLGGADITTRRRPQWSVYGKDRSQLPADLQTWTPKPQTDIRPGPGAYEVTTASTGWRPTNRRGCTWGGRPANLHLEQKAWVPQTRGSRLCNGEWSRYSKGDRYAALAPSASAGRIASSPGGQKAES